MHRQPAHTSLATSTTGFAPSPRVYCGEVFDGRVRLLLVRPWFR